MNFRSGDGIRARICEAVPTSDGTTLSADVYLPAEPGRHPALVTLTPYDNNRSPRVQGGADPLAAKADVYRALAGNGYAVVAVDARGRGDSEGEFRPFVHEASDGADAIAWARGLDDCDGRVGVFGTGYAGFAALAAASAGGADAVFAVSPMGLADDGLLAPGGVVRLEWLFWMHIVAGRTQQSPDVPQWLDVFDHLPLRDMPEALGRDNIWWAEWLDHLDAADDFWSPLREARDRLASLPAPVLLLTGRWDTNLPATIAYWRSATASSPGAPVQVVVGPWDTAATRSPRRAVGGLDFGPDASPDVTDLLLDWFDDALTAGGETRNGSRARVFVTGPDRWADLPTWPPPTVPRTLWLRSDGRANTRAGDGRLDEQAPPEDERADRYDYDPARPVPWQPGFTSFSRRTHALVLGEGHLTSRDDVLVYTTEPARDPWTMAGTCELVLFAQTDAPDTDWIATLSDVFPHDGAAIHLAHAAVRAATCDGFAPGTPTRVTLRFSDVAHELQPGHSLRLTITSSLFPLYARNTNTADYVKAAETTVAGQTIHHDAAHPSRLQIPIATRPLSQPRERRTGWFAPEARH